MPLRKISIKDIMKDHGLKDEEETTDARVSVTKIIGTV